MRETRAFFLSPVPAAALGAFVSWGTGAVPRPLSILLFYLLLLYAAQLVFGVAIRSLLLKRGRTSVMSFVSGGILMTALPAVPYLAWAMTKHPYALSYGLTVLALWLVYGGIAGFTYWFVARPDQLASKIRESPAS